ncbi:hypothetical protein NMG60_11028287 [Bertholletia excelsa]
MGLTGRDSCSNFLMPVSSSSLKNIKSSVNQRPRKSTGSRIRIHDLGPLCKSREKVAIQKDEDDFGRWFEGGVFEQEEGIWLSSGNLSPPSCFDDQRFSILFDRSVDEWVVSLLSNSIPQNPDAFGSKIDASFFDGSQVNPIDEASLVLKRSLDVEQISKEDLKEEEIFTWLLNSTGDDLADCENQYLCRPHSDYGTSNSSSSLFRQNISSCQIWDSGSTGFWVSLFNLEAIDCKCFSDTETEIDYIPTEFASPCYKCNWGSQVVSSNSSASSPECASEVVDLAELNSDEPLFWPSDRKSDWASEAQWDFFVMSPRNQALGNVNHGRNSPEAVKLILHEGKLDFKERPKSSVVSNSRSVSSKMWKDINHTKDVTVVKTKTSRLGESSKTRMKRSPVDTKVLEKDSKFVPEDFTSIEQLPIETRLGLDEFDGREGIESEFNQDDFFWSVPSEKKKNKKKKNCNLVTGIVQRFQYYIPLLNFSSVSCRQNVFSSF